MTSPIGVVCGSWPPMRCGVADFTAQLVRELANLDREIVVVTSLGFSAEAPAHIEVLPVIRSWAPASAWQVLRLLYARGCRVMNLHYPTQRYGRWSAVDLLPALGRIHGFGVVTTVHEYVSFRALGRMRVRSMVGWSHSAIVPDPDNLRALERVGMSGKVRHVPLATTIRPVGVSALDRAALRAERGVPEGAVVFAFFGLISPGKGLDTLLDALERVPESAPLRLWVLSARAPTEPAYRAAFQEVAGRLESLEHARRLMWSGDLEADAVSRHLTAADVAVLPYADGVSLRRTTLIASLAHGLPVISCGESAPCGGIELVPPGNSAALAEAMLHLALDGGARARLAREAREAAQAFQWPEVARRTAEVLDAVAPRSSA